jgi:hypothetical protein
MATIIDKINKIICESSPYGSTELTFNTWWGRTNQIYINNEGEVLWSPCVEFPTGSIMTEDEIAEAKNRGYVFIPWETTKPKGFYN